MKIEEVAIETLSPYKLNSKKHPQSQIEGIAESIRRFGFYAPIVIDAKGEIIVGHGRLEAAKIAGLKSVPAVRLDGLSEIEARALRLIDNRIAETGWDIELLDMDLKGFDFDFSAFNIDFDDLKFEPEQLEGETDPDSVTGAAAATDIVLGDLWLLGDHRLLCGDSTNADDVSRVLDGISPNLMVTDPPYGIELDQSWRDDARGSNALGAGNKNKVLNDNNAEWTAVWALSPAKIIYIWHASSFADVVMKSIRDADFEVRQQIIWNKNVMVMGRNAYHFKHEPCWYAVKKGHNANWLGDRKQTTVWDCASPNHIMSGSKEEKTDHPTQKPAMLYEIPILNHTKPGDWIYEPFGGSGTAIIAAERNHRKCAMIEIDPKYVAAIIQRWEKFTGKKAVRA